MLTWMAWTWPTALLFVGIFSAMAELIVLEIKNPGGDARKGVLGLETTRGDRLFISLLGTSYIFLAWLGFMGMPLWWPLGLSIGWGVFSFWKV
jgi:predicted small integral membrane protein